MWLLCCRGACDERRPLQAAGDSADDDEQVSGEGGADTRLMLEQDNHR
jgi:hypothetical protein